MNPAIEVYGFKPGTNYGVTYRAGTRGQAVGKPLGVHVDGQWVPWLVCRRLARLGHVEIVMDAWVGVPRESDA